MPCYVSESCHVPLPYYVSEPCHASKSCHFTVPWHSPSAPCAIGTINHRRHPPSRPSAMNVLFKLCLRILKLCLLPAGWEVVVLDGLALCLAMTLSLTMPCHVSCALKCLQELPCYFSESCHVPLPCYVSEPCHVSKSCHFPVPWHPPSASCAIGTIHHRRHPPSRPFAMNVLFKLCLRIFKLCLLPAVLEAVVLENDGTGRVNVKGNPSALHCLHRVQLFFRCIR